MSGVSGFRKIRNEGTGSPFMARLWLGLFKMRDHAQLLISNKTEKEAIKARFDANVMPLILAAEAVRDAAVEILETMTEYVSDVEAGNVVSVKENQIDINRTVDKEVGQSVDKLLQQSIVTTKSELQKFLKEVFGIDIGFLFQTEPSFDRGIAALEDGGQSELAEYLRQVRQWHEPLNQLRISAEHHSWVLPEIGIARKPDGSFGVRVPILAGMGLGEFVIATANRVLTMVEELIAYAVQRINEKPFLALVEIPLQARNPSNPLRFQLIPVQTGSSAGWELKYEDARHFV